MLSIYLFINKKIVSFACKFDSGVHAQQLNLSSKLLCAFHDLLNREGYLSTSKKTSLY